MSQDIENRHSDEIYELCEEIKRLQAEIERLWTMLLPLAEHYVGRREAL